MRHTSSPVASFQISPATRPLDVGSHDTSRASGARLAAVVVGVFLWCGVFESVVTSRPVTAGGELEHDTAGDALPAPFGSSPWSHYATPFVDKVSYPIPQEALSRRVYLDWINEGQLVKAAIGKNLGLYGPMFFMPVLAQFVATRDDNLGQALVSMLKQVERDLANGANPHDLWLCGGGMATLGIYRHYLSAASLLDPVRDTWFQSLILRYNRNLHIWGGKESFFRGPGYRAQNEGLSKGLAASWYPDIPEAPDWLRYSNAVYGDWWRYRDLPGNDTGYFYAGLGPLMIHAWLQGDDGFFRDPGMQHVWDRLMYEVTPDGAVCPWAASNGWNSSAATRIWMLELLASKTRDGRYRFVAHKLMNYLRYQSQVYQSPGYFKHNDSAPAVAMAALFADDSVRPQEPETGSRVLYRNETLTLKHPKAGAERYLGPLDPDPDRGHVCHYTVLTDRVMPAKLVLRSGWDPGDLFAIIELYPRIGHMHDSLNPGAILGMTRWGAPLTHELNTKFGAEGCRLSISDPQGTAAMKRNPDDSLRDPYLMEVDVAEFEERRRATIAKVTFTDYMGFPINYTKEVIFAKNRFLAVREIIEFKEEFEASVAAVFNTQNIDRVGKHWANTFFNEARTHSVGTAFRVPGYDLLVFFAPLEQARLTIRDRTIREARAILVPGQIRYERQNRGQVGQKWHFTQLYYPHPPNPVVLPHQVNFAPEGVDYSSPVGTGADQIEVLVDRDDQSILRLKLEDQREEWIVFNPGGKTVLGDTLSTDARYLYLDVVQGRAVGAAGVGHTSVQLGGREIYRRSSDIK